MSYFNLVNYAAPDNAGNVWTDTPTRIGVFLYSILTPTICLFGMGGNLLCLLVLHKKEFVCSFYVYLRVIAVVDFGACVVIFLSGLARGAFWWRENWVSYDALISIPLGGFFSYMSTIATCFVTIDRLIYLRNPLRRCLPKFCNRRVAMKVMGYGAIASLASTLPYCFIYEFDDDGTLTTTAFYESRFYFLYNWCDLFLFALLPLAFLSIGNAMLILSIKKAHRMQRQCQLLKGRARKMQDQAKITATLIAIVCFYLIGEVPTHLTARKTAANLLFGGDDEKADASVWLEMCRQVTTVLNALHLASKFLLYSLCCPPFYRALKSTILDGPVKERSIEVEAKNVPVQLFMVDEAIKIGKCHKLDLNQLGFMNVFINTKATQELPRIMY